MSPHHILVVGVGSIGERHLRCFRSTGRVQLTICEIDAELRQQVALRYGVTEHYAALDEALRNSPKAFDAAVIATPAQLHVPMGTKLAQYGAHILVEKPLSTSLEGVEEMQNIVRKKQLVGMVGYVSRCHPALRAMKKAISRKQFGRPVQIVVVSGQHFPTYRPAYRNIYYTDRATGGGAIQDALTHSLNAGEFLLGPIERVMADCAHQVLEGVEVEDTVHVLTRHGSVLGCYSLNQYQAPNEHQITVICEQGTAQFQFHHHRWKSMLEPGGLWQDELQLDWRERDDIYVTQAKIFLDSIEGKSSPSCTLAEAAQTLQVNLAILRAVERPNWQPVGSS